jgi:hypothetical protein
MPQKPQWWSRIPEILDTVERAETSWFDRAAIERIFGVKRRRGIQLLNAFGGFQAGRTFLIDRDALVRQLRALRESQDFDWEKKRRQRLSEALSAARQYSEAAAVSIPVRSLSPALPAGVHLEPGRLTVEFVDVQDLLAKFYSISQLASRDFEAFSKAVML